MTLPGGGYEGSAIGINNADVFIPELWSGEIKRERDTNFIFKSGISLLPMVGKKGDVVHIPEISRLAVNDKVYNTPVTLQSRTESEYTITIDKYKETSFMIEDIVGIQASYNLRSEYTREAGYALAQDIDNFVLGLRADIHSVPSQNIYASSDGTETGTPQGLDRASILAAKQLMDEAKVPMSGRVLYVSPAQAIDLLTIEQFINVDYVNNKPTMTGMVGSLYGINVVVSNNIVTNSLTGYTNGAGGTPSPTPGVEGSVYLPTQTFTGTDSLPTNGVDGEADDWQTAMLVHRDWAKLAMQLNPKTESSREVLFQADAVVATQIYGAKVYRPDHAVLIHTAA